MWNPLKVWRRRRIAGKPVPKHWPETIADAWHGFGRLSSADQRELLEHVIVFLAEKRFEGCGGLAVTEAMKVAIAAQACRLLLHRRTDYFPGVYSILLYPAAYLAPHTEHTDYLVVAEGRESREGEAWQHGAVVLAWDSVRRGMADDDDGRNVVLHEFAHALDMENASAWGVPRLRRGQQADWAKVFRKEFQALRAKAKNGEASILDHYGAEDPAEFFAVATECFFERPKDMNAKHPQLYEQLRQYYWGQTPGGGGRWRAWLMAA